MINGQRFEGEAVFAAGGFGDVRVVVAFVLNGTRTRRRPRQQTTWRRPDPARATSNAAEPNSASSSAAAANQSELISAALVKTGDPVFCGATSGWSLRRWFSAILMFCVLRGGQDRATLALLIHGRPQTPLYTTLVVVSVVLVHTDLCAADSVVRPNPPRDRMATAKGPSMDAGMGDRSVVHPIREHRPFAAHPGRDQKDCHRYPLARQGRCQLATRGRLIGALSCGVVFSAAGAVFLWFGDAALDNFFNTEQYRNGLMMVLMGPRPPRCRRHPGQDVHPRRVHEARRWLTNHLLTPRARVPCARSTMAHAANGSRPGHVPAPPRTSPHAVGSRLRPRSRSRVGKQRQNVEGVPAPKNQHPLSNTQVTGKRRCWRVGVSRCLRPFPRWSSNRRTGPATSGGLCCRTSQYSFSRESSKIGTRTSYRVQLSSSSHTSISNTTDVSWAVTFVQLDFPFERMVISWPTCSSEQVASPSVLFLPLSTPPRQQAANCAVPSDLHTW